MEFNRRRLLTVAGGAVALGGWAAVGDAMARAAQRAPQPLANDVVAPAPFSVRMPVPAELRPVDQEDGVDQYHLSIQQGTDELLPGVQTQVIGYEGRYIGPTIRAKVGRPVAVTLTNLLNQGANSHLHGGHTPSASDGFPTDLLDPGTSKVLQYPNNQRGTTLWYHDHSHMTEAELVYRGMHGFYILEDDEETDLCLPGGPYDVPIMLTDADFDSTGQLVFVTPDMNRNTVLANGRPQPYFPVAARKYRFRVLNASNMRVFNLSLADGRPTTQIGSDGGLLPEPVEQPTLTLAPAERADIVIDFGAYPIGTQVVLNDATAGPVLRFDVGWAAADHSRVPDVLRPLPPIRTPTNARQFAFSMSIPLRAALINNQIFDPNRVDVTVQRGTTEVWQIINRSADNFGETHDFHIHLVQFRVLDRDGKPPLPGENGLKDTVIVPPDTSVRVVPTFTDYLGKYVYHCHILEHSSIGMMGRMDVVA